MSRIDSAHIQQNWGVLVFVPKTKEIADSLQVPTGSTFQLKVWDATACYYSVKSTEPVINGAYSGYFYQASTFTEMLNDFRDMFEIIESKYGEVTNG